MLKFAALLSTGVFTAGLGIAATACTSDPLLCIQAAAAAAVALVPLALGAAASAGWIPAGVAVAAGLAMVSIAAIVDGAAAVAEGTPWRQAAFVAMSSMVVGLVARGTKVGVALCKSLPAICTRVVSTLTDPRKVVRQVNRVGLQVVGMFSGVTGSQPLLDGSSTNDYGGYQAQRKDLLDARLGHLNASGNDSTSLADRAAALDMPVGARRAILIVDSRDRALSELESMGVGVALLASGQR